MLCTRRLHLSRQDKQSDKKDGAHSPASGIHDFDRQLLGNQTESLLNSYRHAAELLRKRTYLHCWTQRVEECRERWSKYGHNGQDLCIRSSIGRLKQALGIGAFPSNVPTCDGVLSLEVLGVNYESDSEPSQVWRVR